MKGQFYGAWLHSRTKSITQATGAVVFTNGRFTTVYPKDKHTHQRAGESLSTLIEDFGVPEMLKTDRAPEFCGNNSDFVNLAKKQRIKLTYAEPEHTN